MTTRVNNIRSNIQNFKFAVAVGHGAHDPNLPPVLIPPNMYVIFLTKPGYLGSMGNTVSYGWRRIFGNQNKMRNFIKGNLPRNEIPRLVTQLGVDWKKHIYPPGRIIPNHILEMKDYAILDGPYAKPLIQEYDDMAGLWLPSNMNHRLFYRDTVNLQQLVATTRFMESGKIILFISGCRSDVRITNHALAAAMALRSNGYKRLVGRQNYNIPLTNYLKSIQNFEQYAGRYMTLKRHRGNTERRVVRGATASTPASGNTTSLNLNNIHIPSHNLTPYLRMINHIKTNTFGQRTALGETTMRPIAAARRYTKFFPANMSNENVQRWVNSIKRTNNNISNRLKELHTGILRREFEVDNTWRTHRNIPKRILHRIYTIENR
jgi:hypothetical protein